MEINNELKRKVQKAEKLRETPSFPFSLFSSPDYLESGDLFCEVALECSSPEHKVKFYAEAAKTFLIKRSEYTEFRAAECYKKLFELFIKNNFNEAIKNYESCCECYERIGKFMTAGQGYIKIGDLLEGLDIKKAIEMYKKGELCYKKDQNCPIHLKEAIQKCLNAQLKAEDFKGAIESLEFLELENIKLCKQMLKILLNLKGTKDLEEEDLNPEESELIRGLLNKNDKGKEELLNEFKEKMIGISPIVLRIFDLFIKKQQPEHDIC